MIDMISKTDEDFEENLHFGTNEFEDLWEKLIDKTFNNADKNEFYPSARWKLLYSDNKKTSNLKPDSIMIDKENKIIYILDAKYYKYGFSSHFNLPDSADINKQVSYGEYIFDENINGSYSKYLDSYDERFGWIYNAFLIPFNSHSNEFDLHSKYENAGEAVTPWKSNDLEYEHIQTILVDTKFLIYNYKSKSKDKMLELGEAIQNAYEKNQKI